MDIAKARALEYGKAGLPVVRLPSQSAGGKTERGLSKGKPRIISMEEIKVIPKFGKPKPGQKPGPKCSKPGPKSAKKREKSEERSWSDSEQDQVDLTRSESDEDEDEDDEMAGGDRKRLTRSSSVRSERSECSVQSLPPSRGRGRPESTGEYRVRKAERMVRETLRRKRRLEEEITEILNPSCAIPPNKVIKIRNEVAEKVESLRAAPTVDLLARLTEAADLVMRAAVKSSNLQGIIRGELKRAHYTIAAGTTVLASRADKEEEGERGKEVALLRIELETAREDVKRMKERAASDRKKLEECLERMGKMEKAALPDRGGKRNRPAPIPLEDEDDEVEVTMVEVPPASDMVTTVPEARPRVVIPPLDEWPAMRPPIKGVSKRIRDSVAPVLPPQRKEDKSLEDRIMERLDQMLPRWLESRGVELLGRKEAKSVGRKGAVKEVAARRGEQESRPPPSSPARKRRETKTESASRVGPTEKGPPPGSSKGGSESSLTQGAGGGKEELWSKVLGRKAKKGKKRNQAGEEKKEEKKSPPAGPGAIQRVLPNKREVPGPPSGKGRKKSRSKPPRTAAVVLTCPEGRYGEVMRMAREKVDLASLDIQGVRPRRAQTGALILEIPGRDAGGKADTLAGKLREVFEREEGVRVARPTKSAELRLRDLDDSVTKDDIVMAVAETGSCDIMEVRVGDPQKTQDGLRSVWVRCPVSAANKLMAAGRVRLGWVLARVDLLRTRPLQCFKCLQPGHVRQKCPNNIDNGDRCYRCGVSGHKAQGCQAPPKCIICEEAGKPAGHRMGGAACPLPKKGRGIGSKEGGAAAVAPSPLMPTSVREGSNEVAMEVEETVAPPPSPPRERRSPRRSVGGVASGTLNAS